MDLMLLKLLRRDVQGRGWHVFMTLTMPGYSPSCCM
jgi:hypothetical protein